MANLTITVTIDDTDQLILKDDLSNIDGWVQDAVTGKKNHCWKRMKNEWTTKLIDDASFTDSIPSNKTDFVTLVTSRSDYKDRAAKNAAENV